MLMFVIPYGVWQVWICGVVVVVFRYAWRAFFRCFVLVYVYAAAGLCVIIMACCVVFCELLQLFYFFDVVCSRFKRPCFRLWFLAFCFMKGGILRCGRWPFAFYSVVRRSVGAVPALSWGCCRRGCFRCYRCKNDVRTRGVSLSARRFIARQAVA